MYCPKCKTEVTSLIFARTYSSKAYFVEEGSKIVVDDEQVYSENYKCPECGQDIEATTKSEALAKTKMEK